MLAILTKCRAQTPVLRGKVAIMILLSKIVSIDCFSQKKLKLPSHPLSAKTPRNRPWFARLCYTSSTPPPPNPPSYYTCVGQQVLLRESTTKNKDWKSIISRSPITMFDLTATLHGYCSGLAQLLIILYHFLSLVVCHNNKFLLNSILEFFYKLTLPHELK